MNNAAATHNKPDMKINKTILVLGLILISTSFKSNRGDMRYLDDHKMVQVGIVVDDMDSAIEMYSRVLGMEVSATTTASSYEGRPTRYKGQPNESTAKLAFFNLDNISIELIQPLKGPSTWEDFLKEHGPGIHHIAFNVTGIEEHAEAFKSAGLPVVQNGGWDGGAYEYIDASEKMGVIIELLEHYK